MLTLKILGGLAALALGIWLGMPARYEQPRDEIERTMELGTGRRRKVKRYFTPLAWIQRKVTVAPRGAGRRQAFKLERPEDVVSAGDTLKMKVETMPKRPLSGRFVTPAAPPR